MWRRSSRPAGRSRNGRPATEDAASRRRGLPVALPFLPGEQAVDIDAEPATRDEPAVADRPALQAKSQALGDRCRRLVVRRDQRFDLVDAELVDQVAQQRAAGLGGVALA